MKIRLITLGCKTNQYDTEAIRSGLLQNGHQVVDSGEACDAVVVNACAVTATACAQARQVVRKYLKDSPKPYLAVVGCYPQTDPQALAGIKGVDIILGSAEKYHIGEYLAERAEGTFVSDIRSSNAYPEAGIEGHHGHTRAFLKIQEGCNQECAFCIVPKARGRSRNRELSRIVEEAQRLAERGYLEAVLTGTHLGEGFLYQVLEALESVDGLKRIRISSLDPNELSERLLLRMAGSRKVTRHLHIAIQSGDDRVLALMRRPYKGNDIYRTLEMVKDILGAEVGLGTDILVGFPGEEEAAFENTYRLVESEPFTYLHLFQFSPRPGTEALNMKPVVPHATVKERLAAMRALGCVKKKAFQEKFIGRIVEVLVEHQRAKGTQRLTGLTGNYLRVFFDGGEELKEKLVNVEITSEHPLGLVGRLT